MMHNVSIAKNWLAVVGSVVRAESPSLYEWWCLPQEAAEGDVVLMYCPVSVSVRWQGIFAKYSVRDRSGVLRSQKALCSGFGRDSSTYTYTPLSYVQSFERRITAKMMKACHPLAREPFLRSNFQGTAFLLSEYAAAVLWRMIETQGLQLSGTR